MLLTAILIYLERDDETNEKERSTKRLRTTIRTEYRSFVCSQIATINNICVISRRDGYVLADASICKTVDGGTGHVFTPETGHMTSISLC